MKIRNLIYALLFTIILCSCYNKGDYQYVIYMKDGSKVKAWSISNVGGALDVLPPRGIGGEFFLSNDAYIKVVYVGLQHDN